MIRLIIVYRLLKREITSLLYPKAVVPVTINKNTIGNKVAFAVLVYLMVWMMTYILGVSCLLLLNVGPIEALSGSWAMLANLGPALGSIGPSGNYSALTDSQLWCCSFLMLTGRLELFTVFALFSRVFWKV